MNNDFEYSRTISEWVQLFELEPELKSVFVEGASDAVLIENYLNSKGFSNINVYEISAVNIEYNEFEHKDLPDARRSRVIHFAQQVELESEVDLLNNVVCVCDKDFDVLYNKITLNSLLVFTDGTALETYAYDTKILQKFVTIYLRKPNTDSELVLRAIEVPLRNLFVIRAVSLEMGFSASLLPINEKHFSYKSDLVTMDVQNYIDKLLHKASAWFRKNEFMGRYGELISQSPTIITQAINGHDFISIIKLYFEKAFRPKKAYDEDFFANAVMLSLETSDLDIHSLFQEIIARLH